MGGNWGFWKLFSLTDSQSLSLLSVTDFKCIILSRNFKWLFHLQLISSPTLSSLISSKGTYLVKLNKMDWPAVLLEQNMSYFLKSIANSSFNFSGSLAAYPQFRIGFLPHILANFCAISKGMQFLTFSDLCFCLPPPPPAISLFSALFFWVSWRGTTETGFSVSKECLGQKGPSFYCG